MKEITNIGKCGNLIEIESVSSSNSAESHCYCNELHTILEFEERG